MVIKKQPFGIKKKKTETKYLQLLLQVKVDLQSLDSHTFQENVENDVLYYCILQ